MFKSTSIAAALIGLGLTATPAFAKDVQVRYADLNLATVEGQKTLEQRIDRAARDACNYGQHITRSEEHTSELQSLMRSSYAVFCLTKNNLSNRQINSQNNN